MNRKQRRAAGKTGPSKSQPPRDIFAAAAQCHREGRLEAAARLYSQVLAADPGHADSLHRLGVIAYQKGQQGLAVDLLRQAIARQPEVASYHAHLGLALGELGRLEEAVESCRRAVTLAPGLADLHNNLGVLLERLGRHEDAAACYRKAAELAPELVEAHNNLGHALVELGRLEEAQASFRRVIALAPALADGYANLAMALKLEGQFEQAGGYFQRALEITPAQTGILIPLALTQLALGDHRAALASGLHALAARETPDTRRLLVQCVKDIAVEGEVVGLRPLLLRALRENWDRPDDLARVSADVIRQNPAIAILRDREEGRFAVDDDLLLALLCRAPNQDLELEGLLTVARRRLLRAVGAAQFDVGLSFACALARQCFLNEYVFAQDPGEMEEAIRLREVLAAAIERGHAIPPGLIAAVATYFPLLSVPGAPRLLEASLPDDVEAVLTQQLREPREEEALRAGIARLTPIRDEVSRRVRAQYEENPYPRWVGAGSAGPPQQLSSYLRATFPFARIEERSEEAGLDILVAGCGTGRNAIETAQKFPGARTLGVDLSLNSLAHAARKTRELGMTIDFGQADILELGALARRFDLIEAIGVLHHLADPFAGWRVLVSLLKPKGVMMVGFYSGEGRGDVPQRTGSGAVTAQDVRQARRRLIEQNSSAARRVDFFTTSTCRDLLFHVEEHRLSLAEIGDFLSQHNLRFLGFSLDDAVLAAYRARFPDDPAATDFGHWRMFEKDHPGTFSGMYQFWLQKAW